MKRNCCARALSNSSYIDLLAGVAPARAAGVSVCGHVCIIAHHTYIAMSNYSWGLMPGMAALSLPVILDLADCIANDTNAITQDLGDPLAAA